MGRPVGREDVLPVAALGLAVAVLCSVSLLSLAQLGDVMVGRYPVDEIIVMGSVVAGVLAPVLALMGLAVAKWLGSKVSLLGWVALVAGGVVLTWPVLIFVAFGNCPRGFC